MQRLKVHQSLWAMEQRIPGQPERSLEQNIALIHRAGFDGISAHYTDAAQVEALHRALEGSGLAVEGQCFPRSTADLDLPLRLARDFPVSHLDLQPDVRPRRVAECLPLLDGWMAAARAAGVPVLIETHRDRMTTDLHFTLDLLEARPDLPLLADLSHFLVGREFAMPVSPENHAMMQRVMDNAWSFHGRVASREQVQVEIGFPQHRPWLALFLGWWDYGFRSWRGRAGADATLVFTCELGPPPYAITGPDGREPGDRWAEALALKDMVSALWQGEPPDALLDRPATPGSARQPAAVHRQHHAIDVIRGR